MMKMFLVILPVKEIRLSDTIAHLLHNRQYITFSTYFSFHKSIQFLFLYHASLVKLKLLPIHTKS